MVGVDVGDEDVVQAAEAGMTLSASALMVPGSNSATRSGVSTSRHE